MRWFIPRLQPAACAALQCWSPTSIPVHLSTEHETAIGIPHARESTKAEACFDSLFIRSKWSRTPGPVLALHHRRHSAEAPPYHYGTVRAYGR